jgi:hypothetical protein
MNRRSLLACLASPLLSAQRSTAPVTNDHYVSLFNGRDLHEWAGNGDHWKVQNGLVAGTTDANPASTLLLLEREYSDFELRFDLRVTRGAGGVHIRGPGRGPFGVTLQADTSFVRWFINGMLFDTVFSARRDQWYTYRVICKGSSFDAFQNEVAADITVVAGNLEARGKLALSMPWGVRSEIAFRNIGIRETA